MLNKKQTAFVAANLKTRMTNTNIRGIVWDDFASVFIVRDNCGDVIDTFGDLTEAVESLVCEVYGFRQIDPDTVFDIIAYCSAEKYLR